MVISRLLRPHENPHGYWVIGLGISLSGLIQIPLPGFFYERLRGISPWGARLGWVFMVLGVAAMILMGITRSIFSDKAHGVLGWTAFIGFVLSVMVSTGLVMKQGLFHAAPKEGAVFWSRITLAALALIPMLGAGPSQPYLYFFARGLGQRPLAWRSRGMPFVFSLGFWEWLTCVFLIVYLMLLVGLTRRLRGKTLNNPYLPFRS